MIEPEGLISSPPQLQILLFIMIVHLQIMIIIIIMNVDIRKVSKTVPNEMGACITEKVPKILMFLKGKVVCSCISVHFQVGKAFSSTSRSTVGSSTVACSATSHFFRMALLGLHVLWVSQDVNNVCEERNDRKEIMERMYAIIK